MQCNWIESGPRRRLFDRADPSQPIQRRRGLGKSDYVRCAQRRGPASVTQASRANFRYLCAESCAGRRRMDLVHCILFSALHAQPFALPLCRKSCVGRSAPADSCALRARGYVARFFIVLVLGEKRRASLATLFKHHSQCGRILCRLSDIAFGSKCCSRGKANIVLTGSWLVACHWLL